MTTKPPPSSAPTPSLHTHPTRILSQADMDAVRTAAEEASAEPKCADCARMAREVEEGRATAFAARQRYAKSVDALNEEKADLRRSLQARVGEASALSLELEKTRARVRTLEEMVASLKSSLVEYVERTNAEVAQLAARVAELTTPHA